MRMPAALTLGIAALLAVSACTQASTRFTPGNAVLRANFENMKMKIDATSAPAGKVTFLVTNADTVDHEVVILKTDADPAKLPLLPGVSKVDEEGAGENVGEVEVEAGTTGAGTFELAPGKYVLVCNVLTHYMAGMYAAFEVKPVTGTLPQVVASKAPAPAAPTAAVSGQTKEVQVLNAVRPNLTNLVDALQKGDAPAASKALKGYDTAWNGVEVYVNVRCPDCYAQLETVLQAKVTELLGATPPNVKDALPQAQALLAKWDDTMKLVQGGPAISPLFDDVAALRILRTNTLRDATPALKAGDVATAKGLIQTFINRWDEVEDIIKARSNDAYADIEGAMSKINPALQRADPTAAELTPLLATLVDRNNYGISLVNAAARGADLKKSTFTADDVQAAATLVAINNELKASLASWQAGRYDDAAARARNASGPLFAKVASALKAKNGADAAPQKALSAFADVSGKAGDAATVGASQRAAVGSILVAQQWIVGQFWTDPKLKDAITAALSGR